MRRIVLTFLLLLASLPVTAPAAPVDPTAAPQRFVPRPAAIKKHMTFYFGPFTIPAGQDLNRITVDVPVNGGMYTATAPDLIDVETNLRPSNQHMHIHHAHWLRVTDDPTEEPYNIGVEDYSQGYHASWVFGTGEERTQGSLDDRSALNGPDGAKYGIYVKGGQPQTLIYMLHNKTGQTKNVFVTLTVDFVYGSREEVLAAPPGCGGLLLDDETCVAGQDYHPLTGKLWGTTFDVPRQAAGDGWYIHGKETGTGNSGGNGKVATWENPVNAQSVPWGGTLVASAGHLHPLGKAVVIANLGPPGSGCEADVDGDLLPGTTLLDSRKIEHVNADLQSEDYQMGASKFGFRAPIRAGDRITQFGVYANKDNASYEAMSFAGMYIDKLEVPAPADDTDCAARAPYNLNTIDDSGLHPDVQQGGSASATTLNHAWDHAPDPLCGVALYGPCENRLYVDRGAGIETDTVHIADFLYTPGDRSLPGPLGAPVRVKEGTALKFVNVDTAGLIRHSVTSCPWPCYGEYVANYPLPDGDFDSGKLGNLDAIDGGIVNCDQSFSCDTNPIWETPADLAVGQYSYYCRIHPWMRGAFEVVA